ncbi:MAG: EamA family transporter, partial [Cyanobacteria bacterium J06641_5]
PRCGGFARTKIAIRGPGRRRSQGVRARGATRAHGCDHRFLSTDRAPCPRRRAGSHAERRLRAESPTDRHCRAESPSDRRRRGESPSDRRRRGESPSDRRRRAGRDVDAVDFGRVRRHAQHRRTQRNQGVRAIGAARTAVFINFIPVVAVTLAVFFLEEPLTPALLVGGALAVGGIFLTNRPQSLQPTR